MSIEKWLKDLSKSFPNVIYVEERPVVAELRGQIEVPCTEDQLKIALVTIVSNAQERRSSVVVWLDHSFTRDIVCVFVEDTLCLYRLAITEEK